MAACSWRGTSDLSIILNEYLQYLFNWDVEILATDISTRALDLAKKVIMMSRGLRIYRKSSLKSILHRPMEGTWPRIPDPTDKTSAYESYKRLEKN